MEKDTLRKKIGSELRKLRTDSGKTLMEMQQLSGIKYSTISKIETGKFSPSLDLLQKICEPIGAELKVQKKC